MHITTKINWVLLITKPGLRVFVKFQKDIVAVRWQKLMIPSLRIFTLQAEWQMRGHLKIPKISILKAFYGIRFRSFSTYFVYSVEGIKENVSTRREAVIICALIAISTFATDSQITSARGPVFMAVGSCSADSVTAGRTVQAYSGSVQLRQQRYFQTCYTCGSREQFRRRSVVSFVLSTNDVNARRRYETQKIRKLWVHLKLLLGRVQKIRIYPRNKRLKLWKYYLISSGPCTFPSVTGQPLLGKMQSEIISVKHLPIFCRILSGKVEQRLSFRSIAKVQCDLTLVLKFANKCASILDFRRWRRWVKTS